MVIDLLHTAKIVYIEHKEDIPNHDSNFSSIEVVSIRVVMIHFANRLIVSY